MERSRLLAQLTDDLETVKAEMEERGERSHLKKHNKNHLKNKQLFPGSSMTDGSPLVSIRRSLARVKSEITGRDNDGLSLEIQICISITGMDVRIGVVEHSLMQVHHKTSS